MRSEIDLDRGCGLKNNMNKGIIYYTDNTISGLIDKNVRKSILGANLPITSISLKPIDFGNNYQIVGERGYATMIQQIYTALLFSRDEYIFFCEHDVLYHPSHFSFTPSENDVFYYNDNVWRWEYGSSKAIRYDRMLPLSSLCVNRKFALKHYAKRLQAIEEAGDEAFASNEPALARKWGYEPGTKRRKRGGFSDEKSSTWTSYYPNIDIRHEGTFSPPKVTLESFRHIPDNWREIPIKDIQGWNLTLLFNL